MQKKLSLFGLAVVLITYSALQCTGEGEPLVTAPTPRASSFYTDTGKGIVRIVAVKLVSVVIKRMFPSSRSSDVEALRQELTCLRESVTQLKDGKTSEYNPQKAMELVAQQRKCIDEIRQRKPTTENKLLIADLEKDLARTIKHNGILLEKHFAHQACAIKTVALSA